MAADLPVSERSALWAALRDMRIEDPGAVRSFRQALSDENGWPISYAAAVDREYRRFLYLATIAGFELTPSVAVDKAWHLHLTYTRHYWDVLCRQILRRPLHHLPGSGSEADEERHRGQYARTLAFYRSSFRQDPPQSVWPLPHAAPAADERRRRLPVPALLGAGIATGGTMLAVGSGGVAAVGLMAVTAAVATIPLAYGHGWAQRRGSCGAGGMCGAVGGGCCGGGACGGGCGG